MGGAYGALKLDAKRAIDMGTRLALKIHERWEGIVKYGRRIFVLNVGMEERIMEFLQRYVRGGRSISRISRKGVERGGWKCENEAVNTMRG